MKESISKLSLVATIVGTFLISLQLDSQPLDVITDGTNTNSTYFTDQADAINCPPAPGESGVNNANNCGHTVPSDPISPWPYGYAVSPNRLYCYYDSSVSGNSSGQQAGNCDTHGPGTSCYYYECLDPSQDRVAESVSSTELPFYYHVMTSACIDRRKTVLIRSLPFDIINAADTGENDIEVSWNAELPTGGYNTVNQASGTGNTISTIPFSSTITQGGQGGSYACVARTKTHPCREWSVDSWGSCSGGTQTRTVGCYQPNGSATCCNLGGGSRPTNSKTCYQAPSGSNSFSAASTSLSASTHSTTLSATVYNAFFCEIYTNSYPGGKHVIYSTHDNNGDRMWSNSFTANAYVDMGSSATFSLDCQFYTSSGSISGMSNVGNVTVSRSANTSCQWGCRTCSYQRRAYEVGCTSWRSQTSGLMKKLWTGGSASHSIPGDHPANDPSRVGYHQSSFMEESTSCSQTVGGDPSNNSGGYNSARSSCNSVCSGLVSGRSDGPYSTGITDWTYNYSTGYGSDPNSHSDDRNHPDADTWCETLCQATSTDDRNIDYSSASCMDCGCQSPPPSLSGVSDLVITDGPTSGPCRAVFWARSDGTYGTRKDCPGSSTGSASSGTWYNSSNFSSGKPTTLNGNNGGGGESQSAIKSNEYYFTVSGSFSGGSSTSRIAASSCSPCEWYVEATPGPSTRVATTGVTFSVDHEYTTGGNTYTEGSGSDSLTLRAEIGGYSDVSGGSISCSAGTYPQPCDDTAGTGMHGTTCPSSFGCTGSIFDGSTQWLASASAIGGASCSCSGQGGYFSGSANPSDYSVIISGGSGGTSGGVCTNEGPWDSENCSYTITVRNNSYPADTSSATINISVSVN